MPRRYEVPEREPPEPFEREDAPFAALADSEIDYDDEWEEDKVPLDLVEAVESGAWLDDPESVDGEEA